MVGSVRENLMVKDGKRELWFSQEEGIEVHYEPKEACISGMQRMLPVYGSINVPVKLVEKFHTSKMQRKPALEICNLCWEVSEAVCISKYQGREI